MPQGKQAKIISDKELKRILAELQESRYPVRDRVMFLLSVKAGLRAKEISCLTWGMVTDASGSVGDEIALPNTASKGKGGGRTIPLNPELRTALIELKSDGIAADKPVIHSERGEGLSAGSVTVWFHRLYNEKLELDGCSSHSGRRTFITKAARKIVEAGGSLRDIQQLAGHSNLGTTQRYIEGSSDAKRRVVAMI